MKVRAPGRVNLIGEHTDYSGGLVLPMAIDLATTIEGERTGTAVHLRSVDEPDPAIVPIDVDDPRSVEPAWARYVAGVVVELKPEVGFDGSVTTTIPIGTGLSSSSALAVAVALAIGDEVMLDGDRGAVALACQRAEQRSSGVQGGVMDQLASLCGVEGHALLIDCITLAVTPVAIPDGIDIVVIDSREPRRLAESGYGDRRREVDAAVDAIGSLREATLDDLERINDAVVQRRARHVVTENARVVEFADALRAGDLTTAGAAMVASHVSLRDDFEVTTPTLDALVDRLRAIPGVHGARMTGGGFGGCVVALCDTGALDEGWVVSPSAGASISET